MLSMLLQMSNRDDVRAMTRGRIIFATIIAFGMMAVPAKAETVQVTIDKHSYLRHHSR
jgi:hypothetical protein